MFCAVQTSAPIQASLNFISPSFRFAISQGHTALADTYSSKYRYFSKIHISHGLQKGGVPLNLSYLILNGVSLSRHRQLLVVTVYFLVFLSS